MWYRELRRSAHAAVIRPNGSGGRSRMVSGLLLIDFQEEWRTPSSPSYLGRFPSRVKNASLLLDRFRRRGLPVLFTRHEEPAGSESFRPGSPGTRIVPELQPRDGEPVIVKHKISPFYRTDLERRLKRAKVDEVVIAGIMTNLCVRSAVADAYDREFRIAVASDACVSGSAATDRFTLRDLASTRPEIRIRSTRALLAD